MSALLPILILFTYWSISFQDFMSREVYLITYFVLYFLFLMAAITKMILLNIDFILINFCILVAVTCMLSMYYLIRYGLMSPSRIKGSLGWGDVLMLPAFVISFSPANLMVVFVLSLLISLIYHTISSFLSESIRTIPLAGIQSLVLSIVLIANLLGLFKMETDFFPLF